MRHQTIYPEDISFIITLAGLENLEKGLGCRLIAFSICRSIDDSDPPGKSNWVVVEALTLLIGACQQITSCSALPEY